MGNDPNAPRTIEDALKRIAKLEAENELLKDENRRLKKLLRADAPMSPTSSPALDGFTDRLRGW